FDCEAWVPTQGTYRELTSTSNCTTFQARRLQIRERHEGATRPVATLNGTMANTRWLVPILENHQQADGSVTVPAALRPYLGGMTAQGPEGPRYCAQAITKQTPQAQLERHIVPSPPRTRRRRHDRRLRRITVGVGEASARSARRARAPSRDLHRPCPARCPRGRARPGPQARIRCVLERLRRRPPRPRAAAGLGAAPCGLLRPPGCAGEDARGAAERALPRRGPRPAPVGVRRVPCR